MPTATGLTFETLTEKNKQSVPDSEKIISPGVIAFMGKKTTTLRKPKY